MQVRPDDWAVGQAGHADVHASSHFRQVFMHTSTTTHSAVSGAAPTLPVVIDLLAVDEGNGRSSTAKLPELSTRLDRNMPRAVAAVRCFSLLKPTDRPGSPDLAQRGEAGQVFTMSTDALLLELTGYTL